MLYSATVIFLTSFLIQSAICVGPDPFSDSTPADMTSIIKHIKSFVNQHQCPEGWMYFSGSCYYLSNRTSTVTQANYTCNQLHSNRSNLMQIHNKLEFLYAIQVLIKYNVSSLMIEIEPDLLKSDQDEWERMKVKFRNERVRYYKLKERFLNELNSIGFFSNKINQSVEKNNFQELERICDQINWNITDNKSTVYKLTITSILNKTVCLFNNIESDIKYGHICKYVLDYCSINNHKCKHGRCMNTLTGFKCSCSWLYDGRYCEKISTQGKQVIICVIVLVLLYGLSLKLVQWMFFSTIKRCKRFHVQNCGRLKRDERREIVSAPVTNIDNTQRTRTTYVKNKFHSQPKKVHRTRVYWVGVVTIFFLILILSISIIIHLSSDNYNFIHAKNLSLIINDTIELSHKCRTLSDYHKENLVFLRITIALILIFSFLIKREKTYRNLCEGRPGLLTPLVPFRMTDRFPVAAVFGISAYEIFKMFEEFLFLNTDHLLENGILIELLQKIALFLVIGLRYYPIVVSLQLQNIAAKFFACLYILANMIYIIIREGTCMGFMSFTIYQNSTEHTKLRMELGPWFIIIYNLIKNLPHFILLSFITAELFVRLIYDSICVSKKNLSDESEFAKTYVTRLFRRHDFDDKLERKTTLTYLKKFFNVIYDFTDEDFRFTTLATCTYTVAFILLYYFALTLGFLYASSTNTHISFIKNYAESKFNIELKGRFSLISIVIISTVASFLISLYYLLMAMKNYKKHKLELYKGLHIDIPSAVNFHQHTIVLNSLRYFGFFIGHITFGFIVLFHLIFFILIIIRVLSSNIIYDQILSPAIVFILIVYLLTRIHLSSFGKLVFIPIRDENIHLPNGKIYSIFIYWYFFPDCFLGFVSCFIRLIKSIFINMISIARIDYSLFGRSIEKFDSGYAIYVSYIHVEAAYTNPIMLAFCYSLYDDIVRRRMSHERKSTNPLNLTKDRSQNGTDVEPNVSTRFSTVSHLLKPECLDEIHQTIKQKRARFRWFLAYTLFNNRHLLSPNNNNHLTVAYQPSLNRTDDQLSLAANYSS